jgi:hypothetical protein
LFFNEVDFALAEFGERKICQNRQQTPPAQARG